MARKATPKNHRVDLPRVREHIRKSNEEYLAGKSRPMEEFLAELDTEQDKIGKGPRRQKR